MALLDHSGDIPEQQLTQFEREMQETTTEEGKDDVTRTWKEYAKGYVPKDNDKADYNSIKQKTDWYTDKDTLGKQTIAGSWQTQSGKQGQAKQQADQAQQLMRACQRGDKNACAVIYGSMSQYIPGKQEMKQQLLSMSPYQRKGFAEGGLLDDSSRLWKMESQYPEYEKGITRKGVVPTTPIEEQYNYSPTQQGYALGGLALAGMTAAAGAAGYGIGTMINEAIDWVKATRETIKDKEEERTRGLEDFRKEQRGYAEGGEIMNYDDTGSMLAPEVPLNFEEDIPMDYPMEEESELGLSAEDTEILGQAMSDYPELEGILNKVSTTLMPEFTGDGAVDGPGTETSDSINAKLSDGEFVFTAKAVQHLGVDKLRKMMSKAEEDSDDSSAKQEYQQMGDMGYATGGLFSSTY